MPPSRLDALTGPRWRQVQSVLDDALELPPDSVGPFLDRACAGDEDLRKIVEGILRADLDAGRFMETPAAAAMDALLDGDAEEEPLSPAGSRVGPWRIVAEIARGGMGTVYLAERADGGFGQKVALKRIRRGLDTDEILGRFLRERRILAGLEHRNIARLVDGGVSEDGRPWFAMEYVEGRPITTWCEERALDLRGRLRLFRAVCEAVQYAHRHRVVHRDLKPSNIFVTEDGEVKLLDFGIARLLGDDESDETTALTRQGRSILTPQYAAPEQIRGEPATTATDVHGLGVVLYELLCGSLPFPRRRGGPEELRQAIRDEEPAPPSGVHRPLRPVLRGDLDNIVLKALRKEPSQRYPSVEALLADLERFGAGLPVQATPPSIRYRLEKLLRRNRAAMGAAVLVILVIAVGAIATAGNALAGVVAAAALLGGIAVAVGQTRIARRQARMAGEIRGFLMRVFEVSDPSQARGQSVTARELLDQGARRIDSEFVDHPALRADLIALLADLHARLGLAEPGLGLVHREISLLKTLPRTRPSRRADARRRLGNLLLLKGDWAGAEVALREAIDLRRGSRRKEDADLAEDLDQLAASLRPQAKLEEAERLVRRSLEIRMRVFGHQHPEVAVSLNNLALMLREAGRLEASEAHYRESLQIRRQVLGHDHPDVASTLNNLAVLLRQAGRFEEARQTARDAMAIQTRLYGEDHPTTIATAATLGALYQNLGRYRDAEQLQRKVLAHWDAHAGRDHPNAVASLNNLAAVLREMGQVEEAEMMQREAVDRWRVLVGDRHPYYASGLLNLAAVLRDQERFDEAESMLAMAMEIRSATHGEDHPEVAAVIFHQAQLADRRGNLTTADLLYRQAHEMRARHLGDENVATVACRARMASVRRRLGKLDGVEADLVAASAGLRRALPEGHPEIAWVSLELGRVLAGSGRVAEARCRLEEALEIREACYGASSPQTIEVREALGGI